jgi:hypothetical protein
MSATPLCIVHIQVQSDAEIFQLRLARSSNHAICLSNSVKMAPRFSAPSARAAAPRLA